MQTPTPLTPTRSYPGNRGFSGLPVSRLVETLADYKRMRDAEAAPPHMRDYARSLIRELRAELARRNGSERGGAA